MRKLRYRLHWASGEAPKPGLKWVVYDWALICPVAYSESRVAARRLCAFLNADADPAAWPRKRPRATTTKGNRT